MRALSATRATSSSARDNRPLSKETHLEEDEKEGKTFLGRLKVLTFNLLAPCYFRSDGIYESSSMTKAMKRHKCIIEVLREQRCDVCCRGAICCGGATFAAEVRRLLWRCVRS